MARKCFSVQSVWERFTGQSPPSLPDNLFGPKILYWQHRVKRDKWEALGVDNRYLSEAVHLLHVSHPGCFRVWDEEGQDLVVVADIKSLSIFPGKDSLSQGQQHPRPARP